MMAKTMSEKAADRIHKAIEQGPEEKDFLWLAADLFDYAGKAEAALATLQRANNAEYPSAPTASLAIGEGGTIDDIRVDP